MNAHSALVFAIGLAGLCVLGATVFIIWLVGAIAVDLYHHLTGQDKRIRYRDLGAHRVTPRFNVGSDVK
jgi:hypothetical protein